MEASLSGTTSFNTACLVILTIERLLFYIFSAMRSCFGSGDFRVKCQSCCGCFQAKMVSQKSQDGSSMVSEISEAEDDGDENDRVIWADESEERAKEASD